MAFELRRVRPPAPSRYRLLWRLGVGLSAVGGGQEMPPVTALVSVALSSVGPIMAVMVLGCCYAPEEALYTPAEVARVVTMKDASHAFAVEIPGIYAREVADRGWPHSGGICYFSAAGQTVSETADQENVCGIWLYIRGGLVLFLCGVNEGFAPVGTMLGRELAGSAHKWMLVPIGMVIGYFIVKAEPAIQILNHQVQTVSNGTVSAKAMNTCLSIGVAVSIGLAVLRILTGIPIQWILLPGYFLALMLSRFVPALFVGIAFDSGGVASGPMTSTFLLPLCIGACQAVGGNIMTDAFGGWWLWWH